jgi:hypothetical protein
VTTHSETEAIRRVRVAIADAIADTGFQDAQSIIIGTIQVAAAMVMTMKSDDGLMADLKWGVQNFVFACQQLAPEGVRIEFDLGEPIKQHDA